MRYFSSWQFRSARPTFEPGEIVEVYATNFNRETDTLIARVGDSILSLPDGHPDHVDRKLNVEIEDFDPSRSRGKARILEVFEGRKL